MNENDLAEAAVKAVVSETVKGGAGSFLSWLRGKLTGPGGQDAISKAEAKPNAASSQLAHKAQVLSRLGGAAGFPSELGARLGQAAQAGSTLYGSQAASNVSGTVHQVQGDGNRI